MKKIALILFVFIGLNAQAQKNVEKEIAYQGQHVTVELPFASDIEMKTWNKSSIRIEASVDTEKKEYTEKFELQINSSDSKIEISSNLKELIENHNKKFGNRNDLKQDIVYTLYIPKDLKLELSSITGNVTSEYLQGEFRMDLVVGNVNIQKFQGSLDVNSVTGKINLPVKGSSYTAKTVMGDIHGNDPAADKKKNFVGQEVIKELGDSKNRLSLSTVTGDIYLN